MRYLTLRAQLHAAGAKVGGKIGVEVENRILWALGRGWEPKPRRNDTLASYGAAQRVDLHEQTLFTGNIGLHAILL